MAFLDNSGDIILDAVLTDTGRHRMARGDFRITKFALGDDEIDYTLYNKNHPSGSAYYDLEILKTPVLESFTNNTSLMKSKLVTMGRTDFLYMPIMKLHDGGNPDIADALKDRSNNTNGVKSDRTKIHRTFRSYVVTVSYETDQKVVYSNANELQGSGIILGARNTNPRGIGQPGQAFNGNPNFILVETGLDTLNISPKQAMSNDLQDTMFIIEMDGRLGSLISHNNVEPGTDGAVNVQPASYTDDDGITSYVVNTSMVTPGVDSFTQSATDGEQATQSRIKGPRGKKLSFSILPHTNLRDTDYFFTRLGGTFNGDGTANSDRAMIDNNIAEGTAKNGFLTGQTFKFIDTFVRVIGGTTGYTIDIPIRYVKF